jgi:hypothetical protein
MNFKRFVCRLILCLLFSKTVPLCNLYAFHPALGLLVGKNRKENDNDEEMNKKACNRGGKAMVGFV